MAALLSAVFGVIYLLIVCADGLGALLAYLGGEAWTWEWPTSGTAGTGLLRPEIWLFLLSTPLGLSAWSASRYLEKGGG